MECGKYMSVDKKQEFLDYMIHARIGIRVLAEHFLSLKNNSKNTIGIVNLAVDPVAIVSGIGHYVQQLCDLNYGSFPEFEIVGDRQARFAYIDVHLEYILMEIIKNAMRATVEESERLKRLEHPPIEICISTSKDDIIFRFRDQGGGIPLQHQSKIWEYSFTTVKKDDDMDFLSSQARLSMQQATGGPIAGLGFGLPMSRVYAKYFGGMLDVRSVAGYGSDVFLRFPNITKFQSTVQI
ncbi:histidine kinase-like ATPase [Globomyces pollinis-pini]|nr:histidine kinase-like ATPase [Globomyces pollinis-pini]